MKKALSFEAVIFDLDGVITKTALVHSEAWTRMFKDYLAFRRKAYSENHNEFTHQRDYLPFVDGKPRYKGVSDFLASRDIKIPYGNPGDTVDMETVCGLGNRKNEYFNRILETEGVEVYESTISFIHELISCSIKIGVASSSANCRKVLERAGIINLFQTRVDGEVSAIMKLKGKPEPDIFTTASDNLKVPYRLAVVVEDAVSGVQAGKKGNFGFVLGIAREENAADLMMNGADIVVTDISELDGVDGLEKEFIKKND